MFSTNQINYIDSFLATYAAEEFSYYVAYTNTNVGSGYYTTEPDLYIIFSTEEIKASDGYNYSIPSGSIQFAILTGNYSSNNSANNDERVVQSTLQAQNLKIDSYEHIYTNAVFEAYALQPDYYLTTRGETNVQVKSVSFILLFVCIFLGIRSLWCRGKRSI